MKPKTRTWLVFVIVPTLFAILFFVLPLIAVAMHSAGSDGGTPGSVGGAHNYTAQLGSHAFWNITRITVTSSIAITLLCLLIAYPTALIIVKTRWKSVSALLSFAVISQLFVSVIVRSLGWVILLTPNGLIDKTTQTLGLGSIHILFTQSAAILGMTQTLIPLAVLPIWVSLRNLNRGLEEAARTLGANEATVLWRVILPQSTPGVFAAIVLVFSASMAGYVTPELLGGPQAGVWLSSVVANDVTALNQVATGAAVAVLYLAIVLPFIAAYMYIERRNRERTKRTI